MVKKRATVLAVTLVVSLFVMASMTAYAADIAGAESFTGTASGYSGTVRVTVWVLDGEIVDVQGEGRSETDGIGSTAIESMQEAMLEAKTWDVDTVSGATLTSDAMREAARKAMLSAGLIEEEAAPEPEPEPEPEAVPEPEAAPEPEPEVEPEVEPEPEAPAGESGGSSNTLLIVAGVVVVAAIGAFFITKNKKK